MSSFPVVVAAGLIALVMIGLIVYWYATYGPEDYAGRHRKITGEEEGSWEPRMPAAGTAPIAVSRDAGDRTPSRARSAATTARPVYPYRDQRLVVVPRAPVTAVAEPVFAAVLEERNASGERLASTGELRALAFDGDLEQIRSEVAAFRALVQLEEWSGLIPGLTNIQRPIIVSNTCNRRRPDGHRYPRNRQDGERPYRGSAPRHRPYDSTGLPAHPRRAARADRTARPSHRVGREDGPPPEKPPDVKNERPPDKDRSSLTAERLFTCPPSERQARDRVYQPLGSGSLPGGSAGSRRVNGENEKGPRFA
jgi:hypothetical protein